jgi:hypothetical protein
VALNFEALNVKIALDFRAFVLQSCTLYTVKKNEALNRRPHFVSRIPLILPKSESLQRFLAALCHFIKTYLGSKHKDRLKSAGDEDSFILFPQATKEMWDTLQACHDETLGAMIVIESTQHGEDRFEEMVAAISTAGAPSIALHLRISACHADSRV